MTASFWEIYEQYKTNAYSYPCVSCDLQGTCGGDDLCCQFFEIWAARIYATESFDVAGLIRGDLTKKADTTPYYTPIPNSVESIGNALVTELVPGNFSGTVEEVLEYTRDGFYWSTTYLQKWTAGLEPQVTDTLEVDNVKQVRRWRFWWETMAKKETWFQTRELSSLAQLINSDGTIYSLWLVYLDVSWEDYRDDPWTYVYRKLCQELYGEDSPPPEQTDPDIEWPWFENKRYAIPTMWESRGLIIPGEYMGNPY